LIAGFKNLLVTAMTGSGDADDIQFVFADDPVQVCIDEIQSGRGTPMPEE
jgi:hypothetical protein